MNPEHLAMVAQVGESGCVHQSACVEYKLYWFGFNAAGCVRLRDGRCYCYQQAAEQSQLRNSEQDDQLWPRLCLPSDYAERQSAQTSDGHHSDHDLGFNW